MSNIIPKSIDWSHQLTLLQPHRKMSTQTFKPSNLRNSYSANEYFAMHQQQPNQPNQPVQPIQSNNISLPPGLPIPSTPIISPNPQMDSQLKATVMDTIKAIAYRNGGQVYGEYLINEIHNRYMTDEFYRQVALIYQANPNHITLETLMKGFNNPEVLPEYATRIQRHINTMNIMIKQENTPAFHNEINILLGAQFAVQIGQYQFLLAMYPYLDKEYSNLVAYSITFSHIYLTESLTVNLLVDIAPPNIPCSPLPYGIHDYREYYLMFDGTKYHLPESILETFGKNTPLEQTIEKLVHNIQRRTYTVLPNCYNSDDFKEKMDKKFIQKNIIIDFLTDTTNNTFGDYYLTNWHNGFTCTGCNVPIDSGERCCILKCCNVPYHTACLMKCYTDPEVENYNGIKCNSCTVAKDDIAGKNCSILMGISG